MMKSLFFPRTCEIFLYVIYGLLGSKAIDVATKIPIKVQEILKETNRTDLLKQLNDSRRILGGTEAHSNRPYMVYLKLPANNPKYSEYRRWLCGGVIIHEEYILTSAACIEDVKHFYVVSGTYNYDENDDRYNNACIKNGAKKAVWKCIPRNYVFDGHENDNIRWMSNDIAIVKVEEEFDFNRRIRGCEFTPRPICYNNQSSRLENPGTVASIAGWGTTDKYNDWINKRSEQVKNQLLEAPAIIIPKHGCKKRWGSRYHKIIENYMICTKDLIPDMSDICSAKHVSRFCWWYMLPGLSVVVVVHTVELVHASVGGRVVLFFSSDQEKYVDCTDIMYSGEDEGNRREMSADNFGIHSAYHNSSGRRQNLASGGFCENDHGGPLVYGSGVDAVVIGIISACLVKEKSNKCYGPFLYTSVYKNRILINCAIYKDHTGNCNKLFRASETHSEEDISWLDHPDGPAKNELAKIRRTDEKNKNSTESNKPDNITVTVKTN